jgi:hypothetical protein
MLNLMEMLGGVLVLRRIAASHVPASQAKPQVDPFVAHFHAFFANMLVCGFKLDLIQV